MDDQNNGILDSVHAALVKLITDHSPTTDLSCIDDIVFNYVTGVIEEVSAGDDEDVDVGEMKDVIAAYVPDFCVVPEGVLKDWVVEMVIKMQQEKTKSKLNVDFTLDSIVAAFPVETRKHSVSRSFSENSEERTQKLSETSDISDDTGVSVVENDEFSDGLATLLEMFPTTCSLEVQHCIHSCRGDLERATTLILQRQEQGTDIKVLPKNKFLPPGCKGTKTVTDDKDLRDSIVNRYGFVDRDDDSRDHRPVAPKWEGKKMVRYRDNKVVTLKGERYTELKKEETEELKKTYVNLKPAKQYRFH